jgi:hypothetical protein
LNMMIPPMKVPVWWMMNIYITYPPYMRMYDTCVCMILARGDK